MIFIKIKAKKIRKGIEKTSKKKEQEVKNFLFPLNQK